MEAVDKGGGPTREDISEDEKETPSPPYEIIESQELMDISTADTSTLHPPLELPSVSGTCNGSQTLPVVSGASNPSTSSKYSSSGIAISATPRLKAYPPGSKGPFLVFFRPKGKPLNKLQIEKDLAKSFRGIEEINSPSRNKLTVTVSDREQANKIAASVLFSMEYRVYLPSQEIECTGVITEPCLTCDDIKNGSGVFKNRAVPSVAVLDATQLYHVSSDGTKQPSDSYRVIFSGMALPNYLLIGKLRLPVRLYVPKVMRCDKCQRMGHTTTHCCNKPRCSKCGEQHVESSCQAQAKCVHCGEAPHAVTACPKYIEREKRNLRSLKQRSRRTYAEMVKKVAPAVDPSAQSIASNNPYAPLPIDANGPDSEDGEEYDVVQTGTKRKRAVVRRQRQQASQNVSVQQNLRPSLEKSKSGGNATKVSPPCFKFVAGDFPPLQGTSKTPVVPGFRPESRQVTQHTLPQASGQEQNQPPVKTSLSEIVDIIFSCIEVSPATRNLINTVISLMKPLLKLLASKWPILGSFISFDG